MGAESRNPAIIALAGVLALATSIGIGRFVYTPILPFMVQGLGLTKSQGGWIASASFLGYLLGAVGASKGRLPGGQRLWMLGGVACNVLMTGTMAIGTSIVWFLINRFLAGIGNAIVLVFGAALILDALAKRGRPDLAGWYFSGPGVGIIISSIAVSIFAAMGFDWVGLWLASGAISVIGFALVLWLTPESPALPPPTTLSTAKRPAEPGLPAFIAAYGLAGFGYVITATFLSTMARFTPELRPLEPYIWLIFGLAATPSVAAWVWVGRKCGNGPAFAMACIVEMGGVVLSVLGSGKITLIVAAIVVGGTFNAIGAIGMIGARELTRGDPRRIFGIMTVWFGLGQIIGPIFAGTISETTGNFVLPTLIAALTMLVSASLALLSRHQVRQSRRAA